MYQKRELSWKQKSDIESRELYVVQSFDAQSLKSAYRGLFRNDYTLYEREIIDSFDPFKLIALVLRGYETPDFKMRQESNKIINKLDEYFNKLKVSATTAATFWSLISLQSDALLSAIEADLEVIALKNSKEYLKDQEVLSKTYKAIKEKSKEFLNSPKVTEQELQLGF